MSVDWWRDVDGERAKLGVCFWRSGGEIRLGRRLYRFRLVRSGSGVSANASGLSLEPANEEGQQ